MHVHSCCAGVPRRRLQSASLHLKVCLLSAQRLTVTYSCQQPCQQMHGCVFGLCISTDWEDTQPCVGGVFVSSPGHCVRHLHRAVCRPRKTLSALVQVVQPTHCVLLGRGWGLESADTLHCTCMHVPTLVTTIGVGRQVWLSMCLDAQAACCHSCVLTQWSLSHCLTAKPWAFPALMLPAL